MSRPHVGKKGRRGCQRVSNLRNWKVAAQNKEDPAVEGPDSTGVVAPQKEKKYRNVLMNSFLLVFGFIN